MKLDETCGLAVERFCPGQVGFQEELYRGFCFLIIVGNGHVNREAQGCDWPPYASKQWDHSWDGTRVKECKGSTWPKCRVNNHTIPQIAFRVVVGQVHKYIGALTRQGPHGRWRVRAGTRFERQPKKAWRRNDMLWRTRNTLAEVCRG